MERLTEKKEVFGVYCVVPKDISSCSTTLERLHEYEETGLTPNEVIKLNDFVSSQLAIAISKQVKAEKERDYWKREAIKANAMLGEIRILIGKEIDKNNEKK